MRHREYIQTNLRLKAADAELVGVGFDRSVLIENDSKLV
jgi:hypothetical protein